MADVLACIALVISLASVGWQVVTFVGSGSRVTARLKLGLYDAAMTMAIVLPLTKTAFTDSKSVIDRGYSTRCLVVEVSNIGRIGVDVIRCRAKLTNGAILDPLSSVPANPKPNTRLEPGQTQIWYIPLSPLQGVVDVAHAGRMPNSSPVQKAWGLIELGTNKEIRTKDEWTFTVSDVAAAN